MTHQEANELYRVECNMMGGLAKGARVNCVVSRRLAEPNNANPYAGTKEQAERTAAELRALPESYRNVEVIQIEELQA